MNKEYQPKNFKTQKINIRSKPEHTKLKPATHFYLKLKLYSLISNLNYTATHYSLISNSLFSHGSYSSSLSSHGRSMAKDPWRKALTRKLKTEESEGSRRIEPAYCTWRDWEEWRPEQIPKPRKSNPDQIPKKSNPEQIPKPRKSNPKIKYPNPKNETRKKKKSMSRVWFNELSLVGFF